MGPPTTQEIKRSSTTSDWSFQTVSRQVRSQWWFPVFMILMMVMMMMMDQARLFPGNLIKLFFLSSLEAFHIELVSKFSFFAVQPRGRRWIQVCVEAGKIFRQRVESRRLGWWEPISQGDQDDDYGDDHHGDNGEEYGMGECDGDRLEVESCWHGYFNRSWKIGELLSIHINTYCLIFRYPSRKSGGHEMKLVTWV